MGNYRKEKIKKIKWGDGEDARLEGSDVCAQVPISGCLRVCFIASRLYSGAKEARSQITK